MEVTNDEQFIATLVHEALEALSRGEPFDRVQVDPEKATVRVTWQGRTFDLTAREVK